MFAFKVVCLCLSVAVVLSENCSTRLAKEFESCRTELNLPQISSERYNTVIVPKTEDEKCLLACVYKKINVIVDGKFSVEVASKQVEKDFQDEPTNIVKAKELLNTCAKRAESETTDCNLAGAVTTCIFDEFKKAGLMEKKPSN